FRPAAPLPASAKCTLDVATVTDVNKQPTAAGADGANFSFTVANSTPAAVNNPGSKFPHTPDGRFTGFGAPVPPQDAGTVDPGPKDSGTSSSEDASISADSGRGGADGVPDGGNGGKPGAGGAGGGSALDASAGRDADVGVVGGAGGAGGAAGA